jgi:hypothetical protein
MKLYQIHYPDEHNNPITEILTEEEILAEYWEYWKGKMESVGKFDLITKENCLDDWMILHWASVIKIPE